MLRAWRHCFEGIDHPASTGHEEWTEVDKRLQEATFATPIAQLGLGTRATNALDRVNVLTVCDLLAFKPRPLSRLRGVGNKTRRELAEARKILLGRLGIPESVTTLAGPETETGETEPTVLSVDLLARRLGKSNPKARTDTEHRFLMAFLGLGPGASPRVIEAGAAATLPLWPSQTELAAHIDVTRGRVGQLVSAAIQRWKRDPSVTRLRTDILAILATAQGVMTIDELAGAVLSARESVEEEPLASRLALAVTRLAVEVERSMADPRLVVSRDRDRVIIATTQDLADYAVRLGREADDLAAEDPLVPPARVLERLRAIAAPAGPEPLTDARLVRLAAISSQIAAVSSRQELYPQGMDAARALKLSAGALLGVGVLTVEEIRQRVSSRYPEAAPLPDHPALDSFLDAADFDLKWDAMAALGGAYRSPVKDQRRFLVAQRADHAQADPHRPAVGRNHSRGGPGPAVRGTAATGDVGWGLRGDDGRTAGVLPGQRRVVQPLPR